MPYNNYLNKYMKVSSLSVNARDLLESQILHYTTFKQTWSDTNVIWAGSPECWMHQPAFTTKKVSVFYAKNGSVAVFVENRPAYAIQYPNDTFLEDVKNKNMEYVCLAKDKYERKEYSSGYVPFVK